MATVDVKGLMYWYMIGQLKFYVCSELICTFTLYVWYITISDKNDWGVKSRIIVCRNYKIVGIERAGNIV